MPLPNRLAIYLTALGDLAAAVLPFIVDLGGPEEAVGYATSILGLNAVVITFLLGFQKYEERIDLLAAGVPGFEAPVGLPGQPATDPDTIPPDEGDADAGRP